MIRITNFFLIFTLLFNITACSKDADLIFETNSNDLTKTCKEIERELQTLKTKLLQNSNSVKNIRNISLMIIALPTFFTSLLFLDFSDNSKIRQQDIENRINALKQVQIFQHCPSTK